MGGRRRIVVALITVALIAAACGDDDTAAPGQAPSSSPSTLAGTAVATAATDAGLGDPESDAAWPEGTPEVAAGAVGFSRYVYAPIDGQIQPFLLEGPAENQVRCQDVALDCSYLDLKAIASSGQPVPEHLAMTSEELDQLVAELDELAAVLTSLETIDAACAAGYSPYTTQWPNMGIHLRHPEHARDRVLDPGRPDVVMFARPGGETTPLADLGTCDDGRWTGDPTGYEPVGSAFYLPLAADHPDGFTGPIDNWHIHFNSCGGSETSGVAPVSQAECEADGGTFFAVDPQWMIHAYAVPDYDNQSGVFSMWNPAVSPVADPVNLAESRSQLDIEGAVTWSINDFALGNLRAAVGQPVVFGNSDAAPHTITSTEGLFDSGTFGTGGSFEITFDEPGSYEFFCALHPSMTGSVDVS